MSAPTPTATSPSEPLGPPLPAGDNLDAASAVLNDVLACTGELQDDLAVIASRHMEAAPSSSVHVLDLNAALARTVLDWISRWPS